MRQANYQTSRNAATENTARKCDRDEIVRACKLIFEPGQVTELRALEATVNDDRFTQTYSGYFDNPDALADAVASIRSAGNIYIIPNRIKPELLGRAVNKILPAKKRPLTTDHDIERRRWLLSDCDPCRAAGIASNEREHEAAISKSYEVAEFLHSRGWPDPIVADSGNGGHLMFRIDEPAADGGMIENCLAALQDQVGDPGDTGVKVDVTCGNAARLWKLYGTLSGKGDAEAAAIGRPQRMARVLESPDKPQVVSHELLVALANEAPKPADPASDKSNHNSKINGKRFDLSGWIRNHNLDTKEPEPWEGGTRWVFPVCPFNPTHTNSSAVITLRPSGEIGFKCHHDGCRGNNWRALREKFEPTAYRNNHNGRSFRHAASEDSRQFELSDCGNAEALTARHGDRIRWDAAQGQWRRFTGKRWGIDIDGAIDRAALETIRDMKATAAVMTDRKESAALWNHAHRSESNGRINAMLERARKQPGITITADQLDRDAWKFNVDNGTLQLNPPKLIRHDPADLITRISPVNFDSAATCPRFLEFIAWAFRARETLIAFVQRYLGYSLTGITSEQCFAIGYGAGGNGKTVLMELMRFIFGDYAIEADMATFLARSQDGIRNDLAALRGARLATASEVSDGRRMDEALVKKLTGDEVIRARFLYAEGFEFKPEFKLFIAANHKPIIRGTDAGIWRRVKLIPFDATVTDDQRDKSLCEKLKGEASGILNWLLAGCVEWQSDGLGDSPEVKQAVTGYREEMDVLGQFIDACCIVGPKVEAGSTALYEQFKAWATANGEHVMTQTKFSLRLSERRFESKRRPDGLKAWIGIGILSHSPEGSEGFEGFSGKVP
jgi:putative DNA primase/helicase